MTPVHPIDTSGAARPRDRRQTGWRRSATFQVPDDGPPANGVQVPTIASPQALVSATAAAPAAGNDQAYVEPAGHQFADTVARAGRAPQRITGWFVDLIV